MTRAIIATALAAACAVTCLAQVPHPGTVERPRDAGSGAVVVPDRFLRSWDPVTVFFSGDVGQPAGTAEDHPERLVTLSPLHPGAFTWIDRRTLQFRPADPWSPLERFTWRVQGREVVLATLMTAPIEVIPAPDSDGLDPVGAITLSFSEPLAAADLARMTTIELRPLPGIDGDSERWLRADDFEVKASDRASRSDVSTFVLNLATPIPFGTRAIVRLRLAADDDPQRSFTEFSFATAEPFRVVAVGSRRTRFPLTPGGTRYSADQALNAGSDQRAVVVEFSAQPEEISPVAARNLVRLTPAVEDLSYRSSAKTLEVEGDFDWDTLYRVSITPTALLDTRGRPLEAEGASEVYLFFPRRPAYLRWREGQGIVERHGPRKVPVDGRGHDRFDLRIYRVDPLDRSFWPFPERPVAVDESSRPPGPGEAPPPFTDNRHISEGELVAQLTALGSPPVSTIVDLPLRREGGSAVFGLDLADHLQRLAPPKAPGHYLVGLRPLGATTARQWMRVQVTDLCVTTVEEPAGVQFLVTSLATGAPVAGATVALEAVQCCPRGPCRWTTLASGTSDHDGSWRCPVLGRPDCRHTIMRVTVSRGDDILVLDPTRPPDGYHDNTWSEGQGSWLQWLVSSTAGRGPVPERVSHLFTERPVYRPDEAVHVKGYVRRRARGRIEALPLSDTFVVVEGPGELVWRYPVNVTAAGSFYHRFAEDGRPTGVYSAHLEGRDPASNTMFTSRTVSFRLEAYRIPRFEVDLHAPDRVALDQPFEVGLTATYYAGGRVADRPLRWRVTQFPYTWQPRDREGFYFSSDGRFSRTARFEATAALDREDRTDDEGAARITIDPTIEATAQPRSYVVEATLTGADDQTVTSTRRVVALPPFVLGLKLPRYIERTTQIEPEIIVVDHDDALLAGQELTVRLLHRQWHSYLRASDFSDGEARYITDVVDEEVFETTVTSTAEPLIVPLPIDRAGVYVVELEARDRVGRAQVVAVDLYAGGDEPVTWSKPVTKVFEVDTDRERYDPGDTATFVLESPFQRARALVVVETPDGNRYSWLQVRGGQATFSLEVESTWVPRLPVHFVLMRGRVAGTEPVPGSATDLGKPATLAATAWIQVMPRDNRVEVELEHLQRALPGQRVEVTVHLADAHGQPLPGEVTLWLVDQAVLALGSEQRLDPLPDFITPVESHTTVRDTRDLAFGELPFADNPGGGEAEEAAGILDRATVRRTFKPVPFFDPRILVGDDGSATVTVELPDNLTNFKLRAKAVSGWDRFGFATGHLAVRLPLIVQPALPRFVRPGDRFNAAAIGRVVEGEGGPGAAEIAVTGAVLEGPARQAVSWVPNRPERLEFAVHVPTPGYDQDGRMERDSVLFKVGVERAVDSASDAFEVVLPIRDDRRRVHQRLLADLSAGEPLALPAIADQPRPGTVRRSVLLSTQPALVRMAAGLSFLLHYPYGCTEQRLSLARAHLAMERFRGVLHLEASEADFRRSVEDVLEWIPQVVDRNQLVAYWPGSRGYVSLTAWVVEFLSEAGDAGFTVDQELIDTLARSLERALRSDYGHFIDGESFAERCWALVALTRAGRFNPAYAAELARKARFLNLEATANVLQSFVLADAGEGASVAELAERMWSGVVIRLYDGREIYAGLAKGFEDRSGLILPSETRTLAEVTRALARAGRADPRFQVLVNGLVTLGRGDGWGSTNANAAALMALAETLAAPAEGEPARRLEVRWADRSETVVLDPQRPLAHLLSDTTGPASVVLQGAPEEGMPTVVRAESSWIPLADGSTVAAASAGFVVARELLLEVATNAPPRRLPIDRPELAFDFTVGDVVEDHVQVVNPADRYYVAVVVPLAAGMEPLNPHLATAPPEAVPRGSLTRAPTYAAYMDDHVAFYYNAMPKGTYDFYFRTRAAVPGTFIQPAAVAEMMYDGTVRGNGNGARIEVVPAEASTE